MLKKIVGFKADGTEIAVAAGYESRGHCFASATKIAIDLRVGENPEGLVRLGVRYEDGSPIPGYADSDAMLQIATPA